MSSRRAPKPDIHVLIIGTGITGLVLAHGLQQAGVRFSIFEREIEDHISSRDWTIGLHWSLPMLKKLLPADLYARLREAHADPCHPDPTIAERLTIFDAQTTEVIKEIDSPGMLRIDRNRMRKLCKTGLRIQYNKKLDSLTYGPTGTSVTAHFLDGTTATGDLVIGADGARSVVREQLLGPEKAKLSPSPVVMMITTVNFHDAKKARHARTGNPIMKMACHPTQKTMLVGIQNVLDENDPTTWSFVIGMAWKGMIEDYPDQKSRLAAIREGGKPFCEPYRSITSWLPDDAQITVSATNYWVTTPWDNRDGRVTLMGDAAHPMTPIRGQGLNNCIADVSNFVTAIAELTDRAGLPGLVARYEEEMIPRGAAEVEASVQNFDMLHDYSRMRQSSLVQNGVARNTHDA